MKSSRYSEQMPLPSGGLARRFWRCRKMGVAEQTFYRLGMGVAG